MALVTNGKCICRDLSNLKFTYNAVYQYQEHIDESGSYFIIEKSVITKRQFNISFAKIQLRKRESNEYRSEY